MCVTESCLQRSKQPPKPNPKEKEEEELKRKRKEMEIKKERKERHITRVEPLVKRFKKNVAPFRSYLTRFTDKVHLH